MTSAKGFVSGLAVDEGLLEVSFFNLGSRLAVKGYAFEQKDAP
ncbi:hypothetical protein [Runella sp.]